MLVALVVVVGVVAIAAVTRLRSSDTQGHKPAATTKTSTTYAQERPPA
jgi:hypothetical protein